MASAINRFLPGIGVLLLAGLTLASGAIQGRMSNRWGVPPDMAAAGKKLEKFPRQFGKWELQSTEKMSNDVLAVLECSGYFVRDYRNEETGQSVMVAVLVGPSGPISLHTPEICYSSRDYTLQGKSQRVSIPSGGNKDEFWAATFRTNNLEADMLSVYYGWSTGRNWTADDDPRFAFAASPFLYKIQLASPLPPGSDAEDRTICRQFLSDFLPVLRRHLVDSSTK